MSFRFPDNPELNNFRVYENLTDLFNPEINKTHAGITQWRNGAYTLKQYFDFDKAFFTRENLKSNLALFFPEARNWFLMEPGETQDVYEKLPIHDIPDDYLWFLKYVRLIDYQSGNDFHFHVQKLHIDSVTLTSDPWIGITCTADRIAAKTSDVFFEAIKPYADKFHQYFTEHANKKVELDYWYQPGYLAFYTRLVEFWQRRITARDQANNRIPVAQLYSMTEANVRFNEDETTVALGHTFHVIATQKISKTFRDPLYTLMNYSANPLTVLEWPLTEPGEHKPMLYGVELECTFDYSIKEVVDAAYLPFFICKSDSSISGSKRQQAELVTIPMSLKAHKRHWAHWFKNVDYGRFDVTRDTTNGFHVHMDKKGFDNEKHIQNLTWFYLNPANKDFLVFVSERGSYDQMSRYSPIASFPSSMSKVKAYKRVVDVASGHRGAVNFQKGKTVEIRIFRGIVSFAELCKNLDFVDAVFQFTRGERGINQLSAADFLNWLKKTPSNRYSVLKKFIDRCKNIDDLMTSCELYNEVFNITDPDKIAGILNKSRLQLTNAHCTILNRGKRRTFVLNKETGKLDIVITNRSKLHDVDRSVESRYTRNAFAS